MFGVAVATLRAALWLNFLWEKRKKNLWEQGMNQGTSGEGGKITHFGPKMNSL